jgi:integrase
LKCPTFGRNYAKNPIATENRLVDSDNAHSALGPHNDRFNDNAVTLSRLCASDIVGFVQRQAPQMHPKRAKLLTSALRSFFQYTRYRGLTKLDLAAAVPMVANWSMTSIPRAIAPDQIQHLLDSIDRRTAVGCRDYAILLLLARLGLRSGEVTSLELDDIDWNAGQVSVRGKSGQRSEVPLPAEVGKANRRVPTAWATAKHLSTRISARQSSHLRLRGASGVGSIVRHRLQRAGIAAPTCGAHQFRHGLG